MKVFRHPVGKNSREINQMLKAFTGLAKSYRAGEDIEEGEERREEGKRRKRRGKKEREEGKEGKGKLGSRALELP